MIVRVLVAAFALSAAACASAPRDLTFDRTTNALLVVAAPATMSQNIDEFRRVDLASNTFVEGGYLRVEANTAGTFDTQANQINADIPRVVALAVMEVPPGDYARQKSTRTAGINPYGLWGEVCFNRLAPVYSVAAGEIAIIRVDETNLAGVSGRWRDPGSVAGDAAVLGDFSNAQANYPNIVGTATIKSPSAFIRWPSAGDCKLSATFESVPIGSLRQPEQ